jgi:hypothetical protein
MTKLMVTDVAVQFVRFQLRGLARPGEQAELGDLPPSLSLQFEHVDRNLTFNLCTHGTGIRRFSSCCFCLSVFIGDLHSFAAAFAFW